MPIVDFLGGLQTLEQPLHVCAPKGPPGRTFVGLSPVCSGKTGLTALRRRCCIRPLLASHDQANSCVGPEKAPIGIPSVDGSAKSRAPKRQKPRSAGGQRLKLGAASGNCEVLRPAARRHVPSSLCFMGILELNSFVPLFRKK